MTRRALLGMLAAALVDPDRLVWVPDRKIISIPAPAQQAFFRILDPACGATPACWIWGPRTAGISGVEQAMRIMNRYPLGELSVTHVIVEPRQQDAD